MLKLFISFVLVTIVAAGSRYNSGGYQYNSGGSQYNPGGSQYNSGGSLFSSSKIPFSSEPLPWWDTDAGYDFIYSSGRRIPFPQCLTSKSQSGYLDQSSMQYAFNDVMMNEERKSNYEYDQNVQKNNYGVMDYAPEDDRNYGPGPQVAPAAALKLTNNILNILACDFNGTDPNTFYDYLQKYKVPEQFCAYYENLNCHGKTSYRTATGVCNNEQYPYQGSSQTAFDRFLPAQYDDYISKPRRTSVAGGLLPPCRRISLALGHKPIFDRSFNNFFVIFGQVIGHDMALSTPIADTYLTPVSSCTCDSKYDWNKCNVIDIPADDPYLSGQKCMAFPATAQAFKDQICSLGVKEQMNGVTDLLDLSILYGSTLQTALSLRGHRGKLKSTRFKWSQYEAPPAQRAEKSCTDSNRKRHCFAAGDSRLMITSLFTGIETIFLRFHNYVARTFAKIYPGWGSDLIYEEARRVNVAMFQQLIYDWWLPIFFGYEGFAKYVGVAPVPSYYNRNVRPIVFNEVAVAAMRCHTLVRDLFSRCTYDGKRIDQLWLVDIVHKSKPAYDIENNGLDSILCGSFYDYGFAHDGHFAPQLQNRLFESVGEYGQYWRNDLVAINICRGREHGIQSYNAYRQYCGINKAYYFEDFADTINYDGIQTLKRLYKSPDDVDLFVGLNSEDKLPDAAIGPTSACLLGQQYQRLRDGDRLFYTHTDVFTPNQLERIKAFPFYCFICLTVDIRSVPYNTFRPPNQYDNPLYDCSTCPTLDLSDWAPATNNDYRHDPAYEQYHDVDTSSYMNNGYYPIPPSGSGVGIGVGISGGAGIGVGISGGAGTVVKSAVLPVSKLKSASKFSKTS